jgi:type I restriction enzyme S subunit
MSTVENIITDNLPIWSSSVQSKSSSGRGTSSKRKLYGVKKLRELILDLAVRGLLVPQDPNDEPASMLLERIVTEKQKLIKEGKIKGQKIFKETGGIEKPFFLPDGWTYGYIPQVVKHDKHAIKRGPFGSKIKKSFFVDKGYKVYEQQHAIRDDFSIGEYYINDEKFKELKVFEVKPNDIIISCSGTVGRVAIAPVGMEAGIINQALLKISLNENGLTNNYFKILFPAFYMQTETLSDLQGTAQKNMVSVDILKKEPFPLPPLAEQHRIVTKVDELMALCDTLEQKQEDSIQAHETLVEALLEALTDAVNADAFQAAWQRISEHFDVLFTTEHSIEKLKQTILQLAVMGKLVSQDPNDEPASVLLEKIVAEKDQLIKDGKLKKLKKLPLSDDDFRGRKIPKGWSLARLIDVYDVRDGTHDSPVYQSNGFPLVTSKNLSSGQLNLDNVKFISKKDHEKICARSKVDKDDILFAMIGSIGNAVRVNIDPDFSIKNVALFKYYNKEYSSPQYLLRFLSFAERQFKLDASGAVQSFVSLTKLRAFLIPLPPLAEQRRIVSKVDEFMTLCDQLKDSLQQANQTQIYLTDAVVENAL